MDFGNWTDDVTPAGTMAQIGLGLLGVDLPMDARDLAYDLTHWEQTPEHLKQTLIDLAAILPVVGGLKYVDEGAALAKGGLKNANEAVDAADDAAKGVNKAIAENAGDVVKKSDNLVFGSEVKSETKLNKQMPQRGWDTKSVRNTYDNPYTTRKAINKANQNPATAYFNTDGSYVVIDDITNEVVQVSDRFDPNWIPDPTITDPYLP